MDAIAPRNKLILRKVAVEFLFVVGKKLRAPIGTIACASVLFHKFFDAFSFSTFDRHIVIGSALFLAGKIEDTRFRLREIASEMDALLSCQCDPPRTPLTQETREFAELLERLLHVETLILQVINYEVNVRHPFQHLLKIMVQFHGTLTDVDLHTLTRMAWDFTKKSLCAPLCLKHRAVDVAVTCSYLSIRKLGHGKSHKKFNEQWWNEYNTKTSCIQEISNGLLDTFELNDVQLPPTVEVPKIYAIANESETAPSEPSPKRPGPPPIPSDRLISAPPPTPTKPSQSPAKVPASSEAQSHTPQGTLSLPESQTNGLGLQHQQQESRLPSSKSHDAEGGKDDAADAIDVSPHDKDRHRANERERNRAIEKEKDKEKDKEKERERDREREREREKDRSRQHERDKSREKERDRNRDRSRNGAESPRRHHHHHNHHHHHHSARR